MVRKFTVLKILLGKTFQITLAIVSFLYLIGTFLMLTGLMEEDPFLIKLLIVPGTPCLLVFIMLQLVKMATKKGRRKYKKAV